MARYDVFLREDGPGYLLDVQADLLDHLKTRLVVPLLPIDMAPPPITRLHPVFQVEEVRVLMVTHLLGAVPTTVLKLQVDDFRRHHDEIVTALDMAFQGF